MRLSNDATTSPSPYAEALASNGMSRQTAHRYQALANVPQADFDAASRANGKTKGKGGSFEPPFHASPGGEVAGGPLRLVYPVAPAAIGSAWV